ncbi:hypothetical protein KP509_13G064300 [Ceratopteris richardii]|uniref:Uncharacterized protein n=1 Tax=Ceratopteris richardii TaxID=49495 RepID=A0A8T2TE61_CERRI|nr:hypothetical protein KP509_13G064300 [Ceratopteris richardii]
MVLLTLARSVIVNVVRGAVALVIGSISGLTEAARLTTAWTRGLDALLQGILWRLLLNHILYTTALLLLYAFCPPLLRLLLAAKNWLTSLAIHALRLLLTPRVGELPPAFYSAIRLAVDLISSTTWLEILLQLALDHEEALLPNSSESW